MLVIPFRSISEIATGNDLSNKAPTRHYRHSLRTTRTLIVNHQLGDVIAYEKNVQAPRQVSAREKRGSVQNVCKQCCG